MLTSMVERQALSNKAKNSSSRRLITFVLRRVDRLPATAHSNAPWLAFPLQPAALPLASRLSLLPA